MGLSSDMREFISSGGKCPKCGRLLRRPTFGTTPSQTGRFAVILAERLLTGPSTPGFGLSLVYPVQKVLPYLIGPRVEVKRSQNREYLLCKNCNHSWWVMKPEAQKKETKPVIRRPSQSGQQKIKPVISRSSQSGQRKVQSYRPKVEYALTLPIVALLVSGRLPVRKSLSARKHESSISQRLRPRQSKPWAYPIRLSGPQPLIRPVRGPSEAAPG